MAGEGRQAKRKISSPQVGWNLFEQIPKAQESRLEGRQTPTAERIRNFLGRWRHWKVGAGESQENRERGGNSIGDKRSLEAKHVGEPAAEKRTHRRADVIRTVQLLMTRPR